MKMISSNVAFLAFLYFLQGLPYGLQSRFLPLYFRTHGMSLSDIGFFKLLLIPWMLKALWAPFVDRYGTKKTWLSFSMIGLFFTCLLGSFTSPNVIPQLAIVLFLFNLLTSTQDIAVDGLAIQVLLTSELAAGNIAQVVGYKVGAVFSGGLLTWLSELWNLSWGMLFISLGIMYALAYLIVLKVVPSGNINDLKEEEVIVEAASLRQSGRSDKQTDGKRGKDEEVKDEKRHWMVDHVYKILDSQETRWILMYVLVYKLGEQGSLTMIPLFLVDKGVTAGSVGFWTGVIGQVVSITGSVLGGWFVSCFRYTPFQIVTLFSKLRMVPLLLYVVLIVTWSHDTTGNQAHLLYVCLVLCMSGMLLGSGIVTTTTFTLMMYCSQRVPPSIQASHYTTMATVEVLGKLTFSVLIGSITDTIGYPLVFCLFVLLGVLVNIVLLKCPRSLVEMNGSDNKNS